VNSPWMDSISTYPPAVVAALVCAYIAVTVTVAVVAALHPEPARREDALKVLDLLLKAFGKRR
jgi:hypothetical protein